MALISSNEYLTREQARDNAQYILDFFTSNGWTKESVCGMLGNMESESTINPGLWENQSPWGDPTAHGFGLVQWTPYTNITTWMQNRGYEIGDITGQCHKIIDELNNNLQWIPTTNYPFSFEEFTQSTQSPDYLAMAFLANYERPADPNQPIRGENANYWYTELTAGEWYTPRLDTTGMQGSKYYYYDNIFYLSGYGLPNCTCYAWGRWYEITNRKPTKLSTGDANTWYQYAIKQSLEVGSTPKLGAILCIDYIPGGHVAVVEQINDNGSIVTSNSAYGGQYFFLDTLYPENGYLPSWAGNYGGVVQGFIYLDGVPAPPQPKPQKQNKMPVWMMTKPWYKRL